MTEGCGGAALLAGAKPAGFMLTGLMLTGLMLWSGPASAQADINIQNRLNRLENEIQTLNRQVYRGGTAPAGSSAAPVPGGAGVPPSLAADFEVRLSRLESELQTLTGKYEEATFGITQARERLDKLASDLDYRLSEIESKLNAEPADPQAAAPAAKAQSQTAAAPPKPAPQQPQQQVTAAARLPAGSAQEQYNYAFGLLRAADYANAEAALGQFVKNHPDSPLTGNAQYWLAETYYVRGKYSDAAVAFAEGYQKYPKGSKAADNLLKLGMSLGQLNQKKEACVTFQQLNSEFPDAPATIKRRADQERGRLNCS
ncbi:tol-pal system protein YbgF [Skermanella rosea]|uniref:tol-pal system protein YbgF n=1 Tax=Skermanella rosea TaxID=1817965 RepID=UPI001E2F8E08|nr:tol-pal system protein YbgF [Skermanella rosea]UEM05542.1 tol-pal system protein YbgF [Skermanella rosea]